MPNPSEVYKSNWKVLGIRGIISVVAIATGIICVQNLPLSVYAVIYETAPVFALTMSAIILKECLPILEILLGLVAILGIVLVIQPPIPIFEVADATRSLTTRQYWFALLSMVVPFFMSTAFVLLRQMGTKSKPVPISVTSFTVGVLTLVLGTITHMLFVGPSWISCLTPVQFVYICTFSLLSFFNQFAMYFANKFEKTPIVSLIMTLKVPILFAADLLLFPEDVQSYTYLQYAGGVLVFAAIFMLLVSNYFKVGKRLNETCRGVVTTTGIESHSLESLN